MRRRTAPQEASGPDAGARPATASGEPSPSRPPLPGRGAWPLRDHPTTLWLTAALLVAAVGRGLPASDWLLVHLVLLGAASHAVMVWSTHFAQALLRTAPTLDDRRQQGRRLALLLTGSTLVFVGVPTGWWWVTLAGATCAAGAVAWHGIQLWRRLRAALPGRFRVTLRYYLAAAAAMPVGATSGVLLARHPADPWHGRLLVAHSMTMALGWLGLTMTGTLVTLWPTMLRTRMDGRAESLARQALPALALALATAVTGALVDLGWLAATGLLAYAAGLVWWGRALLLPARTRPPRHFSTVSVTCALGWLVATIVGLAVAVGLSPSWAAVGERYDLVATALAFGFALQLVLGALSHLVPSVLGGGPSGVRGAARWFDFAGAARIVVVNVGLVVCLLPVPELVRTAVGAVVAVGFASFLPLVVLGIRESVRARRALVADGPAPRPAGPVEPVVLPSIWSTGRVVAAVSALALVLAAGTAVAAGQAAPGGLETVTAAAPTGRTVVADVVADGMRFSPASVRVQRGDRLVVRLTNADETTTHDLVLGGARTPRLAPGGHAELEVEVVSAPIEGWCSVVGHRQMGMTFSVLVGGTDAAGDGSGARAGTAGNDHGTGHSAHVDGHGALAPGTTAYDPVLPPLGTERVHRVTLTVEEVELEVAPGVWQRRWTYDGRTPGPTLHGRVGDTFEVTLVNHGTIGHSIDFHAGERAPDEVMRTVPPGGQVVYRFTARRAGIWMYHCSTMPMSSHIAAGMAGAVVIEPPGLAEVDRSYLLVQSEAYLGASTAKGSASDVDPEKVDAERPDAVVFNGIAGQYDRAPLAAKVGERVRFWVLDAGPSRPTAFHVVGAQFDTAYAEGAWLLRPGPGSGGSQSLALAASQGGFVETVFTEAGRYPFVSHVMVDAERGAHGVVEVTR